MLLDFWSEFLFENKINDDKQPGFLVGWSLGHKDPDIITLMKDGNVIHNGSWKYSPAGRSAGKDHEIQSALAKMKKHEPKVQGCLSVRAWYPCQSWSDTHVGMSTNNSSFSRNGQLVDGKI